MVAGLLAEAAPANNWGAGDGVSTSSSPAVPKALIAPHAGYPFSGPIAASAYARLKPARDLIKRIVLLGPSHYVSLRGLAASSAEAFATPLGAVPVDRRMVDQLAMAKRVQVLDEAHQYEHSLEVQLPFLQVVVEEFSLVPLVAGEATPEEIAQVLDLVRGGPETCIVVSSDLSHYLDIDTARQLDAVTAEAIEGLNLQLVGDNQACGRIPIRGLLRFAAAHRMRAATLDLRNSGDTGGPREKVVGYGAFAFYDDVLTAPQTRC